MASITTWLQTKGTLSIKSLILVVVTGLFLFISFHEFHERLLTSTSPNQNQHVKDCITKAIIGTVPTKVAMDASTIENYAVEKKATETGEQRKTSFQHIFQARVWGGNHDQNAGIQASGGGSTLNFAQQAIAGLHHIVSDLKTQFGLSRVRMLDIPCGDMHWMSRFLATRDDIDYTGMDIVPELIDNHKKTFAKYPWKFVRQDIAEQPLNQSYDIIFCRMMLQHLHNPDVMKILKRFSDSGSRLLFTTTFYNNDVNVELNSAVRGRFHFLNLEIPPVSLVPPVCLIRDGAPEYGIHHFLGLWELPLKRLKECRNATSFNLGGTGFKAFSCTNWSLRV